MKQYPEYELQQALLEVTAGKGIRETARAWGIPVTSLYHRFHGRQSKNTAYTHMQRLSQAQEDYLARWVQIQDALGAGP
ncbi:hypothetical protein LZ31DRAFT_510924, partial [Colletotrichum somersetense]